jgi:hypothetical protein
MVMAGVSSLQNSIGAGPVDYFKATINGEMPFNHTHPLFKDDEFCQKLISYYQEKEEYEKCDQIIKSKKI